MGIEDSFINKKSVLLRLKHLDTFVTSLILSLVDKEIPFRIQVPENLDHSWFDHVISVDQVIKPKCIPLESYEIACADTFIVQLTHSPPLSNADLNEIIASSRGSTCTIVIYDAQFGSHLSLLKQQIRLISGKPKLVKYLRDIRYYGGWASFDCFSPFLAKRNAVNIGPNISIVDLAYRHNLMKPWVASLARPGLLSFFGSLTDRRRVLLKSIERAMNGAVEFTISNSITLEMSASGIYPYLAGMGLSVQDYPTALDFWNFALCLPGECSWTHRTFEAAMRGCLPVLASVELPYYAGMLRPEVTCFPVRNPSNPLHWISAIRKALALSHSEIVRRRTILQRDTQEARSDLSRYLLCSYGLLP